MTSNSIAYANLVESRRHNYEQEKAKVAEIAENQRHNQALEMESQRHNMIQEAETNRSNLESERIGRRKNTITDNYNTQQVLLQGYHYQSERDHFVNLDLQAAKNQGFNEWSTQKKLYLDALRQEADQRHQENQDVLGFGQLDVNRRQLAINSRLADNDAIKAQASRISAGAASTNAKASMINAFTQQEYSKGRLANETLMAQSGSYNNYATADAATMNAETQSTNVEYQHSDRVRSNDLTESKIENEYELGKSRNFIEIHKSNIDWLQGFINPFVQSMAGSQ